MREKILWNIIRVWFFWIVWIVSFCWLKPVFDWKVWETDYHKAEIVRTMNWVEDIETISLKKALKFMWSEYQLEPDYVLKDYLVVQDWKVKQMFMAVENEAWQIRNTNLFIWVKDTFNKLHNDVQVRFWKVTEGEALFNLLALSFAITWTLWLLFLFISLVEKEKFEKFVKKILDYFDSLPQQFKFKESLQKFWFNDQEIKQYESKIDNKKKWITKEEYNKIINKFWKENK